MKGIRGLACLVFLIGLVGCGGPQASGPNMEVILAPKAAPTLADYGLFRDAGAREPSLGVARYDLVNPLFSDHAAKHRYAFVPDGEKLDYHERDVFAFPVGSVLVKTFAYGPDMATPSDGEYYVETRLLIHKAGGWVAYPYIWNSEGTEALYRPAGGAQQIETVSPSGEALSINYKIPNRNQCKTCHQAGDAIAPIGPKARNLNRADPSGRSQLEDWQARGWFDALPDVLPVVADVSDAGAPIAERARAYLDINCAHCHKGDGAASNSGLWLTHDEISPVRLGVDKHPTAAGRGAGQLRYVIKPGDAKSSILAYRMGSAEPGIAMPELGRSLTDPEGQAIVEAWIDGLEAVPAP